MTNSVKRGITARNLFISACIVVAALTGCSQADEPALTLTASPATLSLSPSAGSEKFTVTSNTNWAVTVSSPSPWIALSPASGSNNGTVTVTVTENTSTDPRSATVIVLCGSIVQTVTVTQEGAALILSVSPSSINFRSGEGAETVNVTSNINWTASVSSSWLSVSSASGSNDGMITVMAAANTTLNPRSGTVTVSGGGITQTIAVTQEGLAEFEVSNGTLVKYNGLGGDVTIPSNLGITKIGTLVFLNNSTITSVIIPDGVIWIDMSAFGGCSNLTSVSLPNSIKEIGTMAFSSCGLTSVKIPDGIMRINSYTFDGCANLTSVSIPNSVEEIATYAFGSCGFTSITLPASITQLGMYSFSRCKSLRALTVEREVPLPLLTIYSQPDYTVFHETDLSAVTLYVPAGSKARYQAAAIWKDFGNIVEQ